MRKRSFTIILLGFSSFRLVRKVVIRMRSWTAEGGLSLGDIDLENERVCFYNKLVTEISGSELLWTALRKENMMPEMAEGLIEKTVTSKWRKGDKDTHSCIKPKMYRRTGLKMAAAMGAAASGGAQLGSSYPDITAMKNGRTLRINTIDTLADGVTPSLRESINAARIRLQTGEHLLLIPKITR